MTELAARYVNEVLNDIPNLYATRITTTFRRDAHSDKPMHSVARYNDMEVYRDGLMRLRASKPHFGPSALNITGEFGPILNAAILDAAQGNLTWSHWEQGDAATLGVYRYAVGGKESHYVVQNQRCAYEGEIAIDPSSGAILRIVFRTDPDPANSLPVANILVEYGVVELGDKKYIFPLKGIALTEDLQQIWLSDVAFEN